MPTNHIEWEMLTDDRVVARLGKEMRRMRLERNYTQAMVAERAGLDRTTIVKLEAGNPVGLLTLVQVLRAIRRMDVLDGFHEEPRMSPMMALEQEAKYYRKQRKRASPKKPGIVPPKPKSTW